MKSYPKVAKRKIKKKSIKKLELKLRSLLYPLIKKEEPNKCVTCQKSNMVGRDDQAGHYIKAECCNLIWRYDRRIIHHQCSSCNLWKRGNSVEYRKWMVKKYGEKEVKYIEEHYNDPLPLNFNSREWLEERIKELKTKKELV